MKRLALVFAVPALIVMSAPPARAVPIELITNGDFESGTLAGWTVTNLPGNGDWLWDVPGSTTPISGFATIGGAANGRGYAVSDQTGPGTHALTQAFTVAPGSIATLAFDMFVNDLDGGPLYGGQGLNHVGPPNQFGRVDILSAAAGVFDTGAGVLANLYLGVDGGPDPHAFTSYLFDITSVVGSGGTFVLRFAETDNQGFFHMGVDNVSLQAVPEPGTLMLLGMAAAGVLARSRRRAL